MVYLEEEDKQVYLAGIDRISSMSKDEFGKAFSKLELAEQSKIIDDLLLEAEQVENSEENPHFIEAFIEFVKRSFFTSELAAKEVLKFDPVPGEYIGCLPYSEVGANWAH